MELCMHLLCGRSLSVTVSGRAPLVAVMETADFGIATIRPSSGDCTARDSGESLTARDAFGTRDNIPRMISSAGTAPLH